MKTFGVILCTTAYVLLAVRATSVLWAAEDRIGRHDYFTSAMMGMAWPIPIVMFGVMATFGGEAGIMDSSYKYKPAT